MSEAEAATYLLPLQIGDDYLWPISTMTAIQRGFNLGTPALWEIHKDPINVSLWPLTIRTMRKRLWDTRWGITTMVQLIIGQTIMGTLTLPPNHNGRFLTWQVSQKCMADLTYPSMLRNRIVTMAAAPPNDLVTTVCDNVLSLMASQRGAIVNNGWDRLSDFQGFNYDKIQTWAR